MRYIFYGAGAIGGVTGAKLFMAGHDVLLVARGEHLRTMREKGLELRTPEETHVLQIPTAGHPEEIEFREDDVVFLTTKSQDSIPAMDALRAAAGDQIPVVCGQNGIENERMAARRFANVYGMMMILPGTHLEPGVVETPVWPVGGITDLGRYPGGSDGLAEQIAVDMRSANFIVDVLADIMPWKAAKLVQNLNNAIQACCGQSEESAALTAEARAEAEAAFAAAGIACKPRDAFTERNANFTRERLPGLANIRSGSSTWQSLERGAGSIEVDYLNGEIVLLGRLHGVPTPVNEAIQMIAERMGRERLPPGSVLPADVRDLVRKRAGTASSSR